MKRVLSMALTCLSLGVVCASMTACGTAEVTYTLSEDGAHYIVSGYSGSSSALTEVTIPAQIDGIPVTEISRQAFMSCSSLTTVTLPDSITTLGASAFAYCSRLTTVTMSQSVTELPWGIFAYCTALKSVDVPKGVTAVGTYAFSHAGITQITLPEGLLSIGNSAFEDCESLTELHLPFSLESLSAGFAVRTYLLNGYQTVKSYASEDFGMTITYDGNAETFYDILVEDKTNDIDTDEAFEVLQKIVTFGTDTKD